MPTPGVPVGAAGEPSVSPGDVLDVNMTGFMSTTAVYTSVVFVPDVSGQFVIPTWRNITNDPNNTNDFYPQFYLPVSGRSNDNLEPTEALAQQIGGNVQIEAVFVRETVAPGSGAQYAFTLRDSGANTPLATTLSGTNLTACASTATVAGCTTGSAVTVNNFDLLDTSVVPTGNPATSAQDYGAAVRAIGSCAPVSVLYRSLDRNGGGSRWDRSCGRYKDQNGSPLVVPLLR